MAETDNSNAGFLSRAAGVFGYSRRALDLVWTTSPALTLTLAFLTLVAGVLPAAIAYVGQLIVDGVVTAMSSTSPDTNRVLWLVALGSGHCRFRCCQPAWHVCLPVLVACTTWPTSQRNDPGKGIDAAALALRGLGVL